MAGIYYLRSKEGSRDAWYSVCILSEERRDQERHGTVYVFSEERANYEINDVFKQYSMIYYYYPANLKTQRFISCR